MLQKLAKEWDEALREDWKEGLHNNFVGDGSEFVFVDETSKNDLTYARRYGRSLSGEPATLTDVFVRGDWYSLAAAITKEGYIAACAVPGSFDTLEFYDFICEEVVSLSSLGCTIQAYQPLETASQNECFPRRALSPCTR